MVRSLVGCVRDKEVRVTLRKLTINTPSRLVNGISDWTIAWKLVGKLPSCEVQLDPLPVFFISTVAYEATLTKTVETAKPISS